MSNLQWDGGQTNVFVNDGATWTWSGEKSSRGGAHLHGGGVDNGVEELVILCHLLGSDNLRLTSVTHIVV